MNTLSLQNTWNERKEALAYARLQEVATLALTKIVNDVNLPAVQAALEEACRTATSVHGLRTPLWEYKVRIFDLSKAEEEVLPPESMYFTYDTWRQIRTKWVKEFNLHTVVTHGEDEMSMREVITKTDLLDRLTVTLFGTKHFRIIDRVVAVEEFPLHRVKIVTRQLFVLFFPKGLAQEKSEALELVALKHSGLSVEEVDELEEILCSYPTTRCFCAVCVAE